MLSEACGLIAKGSIQIPLAGVNVSADVLGRGARVRVRHTFINREENPVEAVYKFPLPENGTICGFRAKIGDREIRGDIEDKEKAFEKYDDALVNGDGAYLLDEERPNIFTLSVGNLNAGMTASIEIDYVCLLETHGSEVRFLLPTTIAPRYIPQNCQDEKGIPVDEIVNPHFALDVPYGLKVTVNLYGKDQISAIESPSHRISSNIETSPIKIEFSSETVKMDRDFVLNILYKKEFENRGYLYFGNNGRFLQVDLSSLLSDQHEVNDDKIVKYQKEIIFVLDCSGSMNGSSIDEAKKAIGIFIKGLDEGVKFNVYRFGNTYSKLFESSVDYNSSNVQQAIDYINNTDADMGGTELLGPLRDIYSVSNSTASKRDIVIITDGEIGNEVEVLNLVRHDRDWTRVFAVGIGHGPNEYLIRQLARAAYGSAELIAPGERIEPKIIRLFKKVKTASLHDLKIEMPDVLEQAPCSPVVHEGDTVTIIGKLTSDFKSYSQIKVSGIIDNVRREWMVPVDAIQSPKISIPLLWARERIRDLEEGTSGENRSGSQQNDRMETSNKKKILDISKEFGIISRETSFIAVETRTDEDKTKIEPVLRRIPVMLTKDWGGVKENITKFSIHPGLLRTFQAIRKIEPRNAVRQDVKRSSSKKAEKRTNLSSEDIVISILLLQRPFGGFYMNREIYNILGLSMSKLHKISKAIQMNGKGEKPLLLNTALILALLKHKFADDKELWEAVVLKSADWLENEVARLRPTYEGIELEQWAEEHVKINVVFKQLDERYLN